MTKRFDLYGSQSIPLDELARRVEVALGLLVEPHDSSYRGGEYYRGSGDAVDELIVQANFEDEDGYLAEPDFPNAKALVYVTAADEATTERLRDLSDLILLRTEVL